MPEWCLAITLLAALGLMGLAWRPLLVALPVAGAALVTTVVAVLTRGFRTRFRATSAGELLRLRLLTSFLTAAQPLARMAGRIGEGLTPWSHGHTSAFVMPRPREQTVWCTEWQEPSARVEGLERRLRAGDVVVDRGGPCERWDLATRGGLFGSARARFAVEDHGGGNQYVRARVWPCWPAWCLALIALLALLAALALADDGELAAAVLGGAAALLSVTTSRGKTLEC
jgi:hypothetical protein